MRPQKQKFKHDPANGVFGDCHRTAIAMILNLDRDLVPHFMDGVMPGAATAHVDEAIAAFLADYGLEEVSFPLMGDLSLESVLKHIRVWCKAPVILGGESTTGVNHSVVVHRGEIHNPNDAPLIGPCSDGLWWVTAFAVGENWRAT